MVATYVYERFSMTSFTPQDLDIFYISFDEPNCDANWKRVLELIPNAKRVHGVVGFDAVHRTCALASKTHRFVTIDGDNWLNDGLLTYTLDDTNKTDVCFSFKSKNAINGLEYGNGGVKVWDKATYLSSKTHESTSNGTDFCWDIRYFQEDFLASSTVNNCSAFQAWRAGYREGTKMGYVDGKPLTDFRTQWTTIPKQNLSRLMTWATIGRDKANGIWAIVGARMALVDRITNTVPHTVINDYSWFVNMWETLKESNPEQEAIALGIQLTDEYNIYIPEFDDRDSMWFKMVYVNPKRSGFMLT